MQILSFAINAFGHLDMYSHTMKDGNIFCGDHGVGKTEALLSVMSVLSDKEYKSIDDPITKGKKKHKNVVELKVESGDEITLMDHVFRCEAGDNITCTLVKTRSGSPELTLFNSSTGKQYKGTTTETRKIVDRFLGRFPDPKRLDDLGTGSRSEREEFVKIVASMSKTKEGDPIDFTPFIERETALQEEHSTQKAHLKVLRDDFESMPVPQGDWAKVVIDQKAVSDEIQRFNDHENENKKRLLIIQDAVRKLTEQQTVYSDLNVQKVDLSKSIEDSTADIAKEREGIEALKGMIENYKAKNPIVKPEDTEDLTKQIEALQARLKTANGLKEKNQGIEKVVLEKQNSVISRTGVADESEKAVAEKRASLTALNSRMHDIQERIIPMINIQVEKAGKENKNLPWTGEKDPEEVLEVLPYLNDLMSKAVLANKQVADREKYEGQKVKIESTEKQMKENTESKNQVKADEKMVIESSAFPHPGIQIRRGDDDKVGVWIKDPHDQWIIYNDGNHAHRLEYSTNIVTHGAGGDLKLLVVREGYALHQYMVKRIIEAANRKGFKVMLETLTSDDPCAIYLGEAKNPQEIVSASMPAGEKEQSGIPAFGVTK